MRSPLLSALLLFLPAAPALAQRVAIPSKVAPGAALAQLQVVHAGPGGGPHTAPLPDPVTRTPFLAADARRALLGGAEAADQPLRVEPAPAGTQLFIRLTNPRLVANRSVWSSGRVEHVPFASFLHPSPAGWEGVTVTLESAAAPRYLADCEVGVASSYQLESPGSRAVVSATRSDGATMHLHFLVEIAEPARGGGFELSAAENSPWTFYGCELTPVR